MRKSLLSFVTAIMLAAPIWAQEMVFPTLDELADLQIPGYDYADLVQRLSWRDISHTPPAAPPVYQIGDTETFRVPTETDNRGEPITTVLLGMTDNVLVWIDESERISAARVQWLAEEIDETIVQPLHQLFDYDPPPGVDGDPRIYVVGVRWTDWNIAGYFASPHAAPRSVLPESNEHEMLVVNLSNRDKSDVFDPYFLSTVAHEYQHVLRYHRDPSEEKWLDEALSMYVMHHFYGYDHVAYHVEQFLAAPQTALKRFHRDERIHKDYGAGLLFTLFLAERFGSGVVRDIQAEPEDGWRGIEKVLHEAYDADLDEVFADWVLANYFMDAESGFGYTSIDQPVNGAQSAATIRSFPALQTNSLKQYSTDYYAVDVRGAEQLKLRLIQSPEAYLIEGTPKEGDYFYFGATNGFSASRLVRQFDLRRKTRAVLKFGVWFDLEEGSESGYVQVSDDGGDTWRILRGLHTSDEEGRNRHYDHGYTGHSGGWLDETIGLHPYLGRSILLRFELLSDAETKYRGIAIDDLRIEGIDFQDGFEAPDSDWIAEGWIRTDNRLPQRTWVQVVQEGPDGLTLHRYLQTASGEMTIDLLPGVDRAVVAISPIAPLTGLPSQYSLQFNLIDASGSIMRVSRDCTVTTTHGLNFRDAPNGQRIGLVPAGTVATALDKRGDWFRVEYDDTLGWISAGYVSVAGNCG